MYNSLIEERQVDQILCLRCCSNKNMPSSRSAHVNLAGRIATIRDDQFYGQVETCPVKQNARQGPDVVDAKVRSTASPLSQITQRGGQADGQLVSFQTSRCSQQFYKGLCFHLRAPVCLSEQICGTADVTDAVPPLRNGSSCGASTFDTPGLDLGMIRKAKPSVQCTANNSVR